MKHENLERPLAEFSVDLIVQKIRAEDRQVDGNAPKIKNSHLKSFNK